MDSFALLQNGKDIVINIGARYYILFHTNNNCNSIFYKNEIFMLILPSRRPIKIVFLIFDINAHVIIYINICKIVNP